MLLEVCVTSISSIKKAALAGADRIELCSALGVGGVTPSYGLIEEAVHLDALPIHCLIRPREGHFIYTSEEVEIIDQDILAAKKLGCRGVVVGALTPQFHLDIKRLERWKELAGSMYMTFHRAFDVVQHPHQALKELIALGFDCVLSSGQEEKAMDGFNNLDDWNNKFGDQIGIMPGSCINDKNCSYFKEAGFKAIHLSGSVPLEPISIPSGVNQEMSFLNQEILESNSSVLKKVVQQIRVN